MAESFVLWRIWNVLDIMEVGVGLSESSHQDSSASVIKLSR